MFKVPNVWFAVTAIRQSKKNKAYKISDNKIGKGMYASIIITWLSDLGLRVALR